MLAIAGLSPLRLLTVGALGGGVLLGAGAWLLWGGASAAQDRLQTAQDHLSAARLGLPKPTSPFLLLADASQRPLFALTTGPGAVPDVTLTLDGLARTPQHVAALVSINGAPDVWLDRGKSVSGVTLVDVADTRITVETALGQKQVEMAQGPPSGQQESASPPPPHPSPMTPPRPFSPPSFMGSNNQIPPGMHLPPSPASAPSAP